MSRIPHTLVLLFGMVLAAYALTWALPQGAFERVDDGHGHERVVYGSYRHIESPERLHFTAPFTAVPRGFEKAQDIIFFIFLIGGCFGVFRATGAADAAIAWLLRSHAHRPAWLIGGTILVFAVGSSTIGMAEEYVPFVPVLIALSIGLGLDPLVACAIVCVGYGAGYGAAAINPFTVVVAQGIAGLEPISGLGLRLAIFPIFVAVGIHHTVRYARRIRQDPAQSLVADIDKTGLGGAREHAPFSVVHALVLLVTIATIGFLVFAIKKWEWYLAEMSALFIALSIVYGVIARIGPNALAKHFCAGAGELTTTALLVGFARAIQVILDDGKVIDTIVDGVSTPLLQLGSHFAAVGMFLVQSLCNLFIPSGSGQAYVTMPLMAPLGDIVGVPRQVSVLAFQFGDGFTNMIIPTNAVLIGILTMARVPFDRWLRFAMPLMVKFWVVGSLILVVAVAIGYGEGDLAPAGGATGGTDASPASGSADVERAPLDE